MADGPQYEYNEHTTNKEDNDPILHFQNIETDTIPLKKIELKGIPFYSVSGDELVAFSLSELRLCRGEPSPGKNRRKKAPAGSPGPRLVLPFDPYRFLWVRMHKKVKAMAAESFLNIPDGAGMTFSSSYKLNPVPERISLVNYTVNMLRLAEAKEYTAFIVGSKNETLEKLSHNLKRSFPEIRIVGRHHGFIKKSNVNERVIEALRKTEPHIVILDLGYHRGMKWLLENRERLGTAIIINAAGLLETLAGTRRKAPDFITTRGLSWLWRTVNRPWRWHRFLLVIYWFSETMFHKVFLREKKQS